VAVSWAYILQDQLEFRSGNVEAQELKFFQAARSLRHDRVLVDLVAFVLVLRLVVVVSLARLLLNLESVVLGIGSSVRDLPHFLYLVFGPILGRFQVRDDEPLEVEPRLLQQLVDASGGDDERPFRIRGRVDVDLFEPFELGESFE
jgi:hypothetical protein